MAVVTMKTPKLWHKDSETLLRSNRWHDHISLSNKRSKSSMRKWDSYSVINISVHFISLIGSDKKNHKGAETWMLAQRIGPLDMSKVVTENSPAKETNITMQSAQRASIQTKNYCDC